MITLSEANNSVGNTRRVFQISLILPIVMGAIGWGFASGAAPTLGLHENYLAMLGLVVSGFGFVAFPFSYLIKWNWKAKCYGAGTLSFVTASILTVYPIICIVVFGKLSYLVSAGILGVTVIFILRCCRRVIKIYSKIYIAAKIFNRIYIEKNDVVFYLFQEDKKAVEKTMKFDFSPHPLFLIGSMVVAIFTVPFASSISQSVGVPFILIFCAIGGLPIGQLITEVSVKCVLVFYYYPQKIKRKTGKHVYVDISSLAEKYCSNQLSVY